MITQNSASDCVRGFLFLVCAGLSTVRSPCVWRERENGTAGVQALFAVCAVLRGCKLLSKRTKTKTKSLFRLSIRI